MSQIDHVKQFTLASGNPHKTQEFESLFDQSLVITPAPHSIEVHEKGKTFTENAFLKAEAYFNAFKIPSISDDSGLVLEAFPDLLGVQSARFSPETPSYHDKCQKILDLYLHHEKGSFISRKAYFMCVLCFYFSPDEVYFFEGQLQGKISTEIKGQGGFGYDPIFIPDRKEEDGQTLAQLSDWKMAHSHRAKAVDAAKLFFKFR